MRNVSSLLARFFASTKSIFNTPNKPLTLQASADALAQNTKNIGMREAQCFEQHAAHFLGKYCAQWFFLCFILDYWSIASVWLGRSMEASMCSIGSISLRPWGILWKIYRCVEFHIIHDNCCRSYAIWLYLRERTERIEGYSLRRYEKDESMSWNIVWAMGFRKEEEKRQRQG